MSSTRFAARFPGRLPLLGEGIVMKALVAACALVFGLASAATAGESAVTPDTLDQMGLAGMDTLSDSEGMTVRGKGPFGSFAGFGGLGSFGNIFGSSPEATEFIGAFSTQFSALKPAFFANINGLLPEGIVIPFPQ
jgi:hypothetical protein